MSVDNARMQLIHDCSQYMVLFSKVLHDIDILEVAVLLHRSIEYLKDSTDHMYSMVDHKYTNIAAVTGRR